MSEAFVVVLLRKACGFDMNSVKYPQSRVCVCVCVFMQRCLLYGDMIPMVDRC